ncbi:MAG TPA: site-specific integrase [Acidimicrobiales bacterium]|nr:site-specific integrase [Acidimicrobiales bacterium]
MVGSLREKSPGMWELRVYLGRDAAGKVRHKHTRFRGGKRQAERELARLVAELDAGDGDIVLDWGPETTVNDAVVGWQRNGWDDLSPSTVRRYRSIWKVHVKDDIGRRKIRSLGPYDVECYLRKLKQEGQSESSVHQIRAFLHRACRLARKWSGNRLPNPVADTDLPEWALSEKAEHVRAPELGEIRAVLAAARRYDRRVATFIRVVAASGARRGEVCALRWSDIDWDRCSVRIDEAVVADDGGVVVKGPKNRSSVRVVALDSATLDELRELREERDELADACGASVVYDGFVFSTEPSGQAAPNPDGFTHAFTRCRDLAGVAPDVHLHSLRHFQSTQLDTVISEAQKQARMGWASVHMARHYTDAITEEDRRAAEHIGEALGGSADGGEPLRRSAVRFRP